MFPTAHLDTQSQSTTIQHPSFDPQGRKSLVDRCPLAWAWLWVSAFLLLVVVGARASDYVLVVDVSGSMTGPVSRHNNQVRIAVVQQALRRYLPALPQGSRVDLIAFSSGILSECELHLDRDQDVKLALSWVDGLYEQARKNGETHLWTTLRHALQVACRYSQEKPEQPVTVRVLTDGEDNERVTTLDKVLHEFLPVLDGERIRGNLVLLGDLELKTKLSGTPLPEGAFETTTNMTWEDMFPPVVLWSPKQPVAGDVVNVFENTKSIYSTYEWQVDGRAAGNDKVLTAKLSEARPYKVTLRVSGLHGTKNSTTVLIPVRQPERLEVDFVAAPSEAEPQQGVRFVAKCQGSVANYEWYIDGSLVGTNQDLTFTFHAEGGHDIRLVARSVRGATAEQTRPFEVRERLLSVGIKAPKEATEDRPVQFASEISGPCASVEWNFGDGETSPERNPEHLFARTASPFQDRQVTLRVTSPTGKIVEATPQIIRIFAEKKASPPQAKMRVLSAHARVGDAVQLIDESQGVVDAWEWEIPGEFRSKERNPVVRPSSPGRKNLRLRVSGPGGRSEADDILLVVPRYAPATVRVTASPQSGTAPLPVQLNSLTSGEVANFRWDFGDGESSTNPSPRHTFTQATNYSVTVTAFPADPDQKPFVAKVAIQVRKPIPGWAKILAFVACTSLMMALTALLVQRQRKKALRLQVHFWQEDNSIPQTMLFTEIDETRNAPGGAPIRIKREGRSRNLAVEALEGATFMDSCGREVPVLNLGRGARIVVKTPAGETKAIAISAELKPSRPAPVSSNLQELPESEVQPARVGEDFDWGWHGSKSSTQE